jgi:2'-5' RNA ligase
VGEIAEDVAADLDGELSAITAPPFEVVLKGVGSFGEGRDIRAVWAGWRRTRRCDRWLASARQPRAGLG